MSSPNCGCLVLALCDVVDDVRFMEIPLVGSRDRSTSNLGCHAPFSWWAKKQKSRIGHCLYVMEPKRAIANNFFYTDQCELLVLRGNALHTPLTVGQACLDSFVDNAFDGCMS